MDQKSGKELVVEARDGRLNLEHLVGNPAVEEVHIAAILGTMLARADPAFDQALQAAEASGYQGLLSRNRNDMDARIETVLRTKVEGKMWSHEDVTHLVQDYVQGSVTDQHLAALLGAIMVKGMATTEIVSLTRAMWQSGKTLDFSELRTRGYVMADKHSTGGIGDGVSLVLAPLVAVMSPKVCVPMMSGRALGHTGGTLDKLEAIPGYRVDLSEQEIQTLMQEVRCAIFAQSPALAPADGLLYALRDKVNCVADVGLIVGSILSKKLAEGTNILVMDTKTGNGAFLDDYTQAKTFAQLMCDVGSVAGLKTAAFITDMNEPLAPYAGNLLEIAYTIETLQGKHKHSRFWKIVEYLAAEMLQQAFDPLSLFFFFPPAYYIDNGAALAKFQEMVAAQGGDAKYLQRFTKSTLAEEQPQSVREILDLPAEYSITAIPAIQDGYLAAIEMKPLGFGIRDLAGNSVDPYSGLIFKAGLGDRVTRGQPLAYMIHIPGKGPTAKYFQERFHLSETPPPISDLMKERLVPAPKQ